MLGLKDTKSVGIFVILIIISIGLLVTIITSIFGSYGYELKIVDSKIEGNQLKFTEQEIVYFTIFNRRMIISNKQKIIGFDDPEMNQ